jgi:DNA adenine methylase
VKAPFPWFGGKRRVADVVWAALGDVDNYVEPFAGSLATLLARPVWHKRRAETVNDMDQFLSNFWRALAHDPEAVAVWADWPVNEADLFARHLWLVNEGRDRIARMDVDPDFYDAKVAGWWVWGINAWIGSGWCSGTGPHTYETSKRPHLGNAGQGVNRQRPHLGNALDEGTPDGASTVSVRTSGTPDRIASFVELADRLRKVRVCCGDWSRVVTTGALNYGATKGVLLDPPYLGDVRTADLYASDDHTIAGPVRDWAIANGDNPAMRIVLCGYEPEHIDHMPDTWQMVTYSASKSYGSAAGGGVNDANRHLERLWLSPHCLTTDNRLFGDPA